MDAMHKDVNARDVPNLRQAQPTTQVHPPREEDNDQYRTLKILAAGGLSGAVSRTVTAPVDRMKMLMMIQDTAEAKSLRWGVERMASEGSLRSFFKGNGTNVVKIVPEHAMKLTGSDVLKKYLVQDLDDIQPVERFACGALAGASAQFTIYPMELIRTRLAICQTGKYRGITSAACQIFREEGWKAFYRGLTPAMIGILPYAGVEIATFEMMIEFLNERYNGNVPAPLILGTGMCSSTCAQLVSFPLALVRTRLQAQGIKGGKMKYTGMWDVAQKTYAKEGVRGFYKGLLPNMIKVAPAAGISWFVFEKTKKLLGL